jgi:hypothetical protein
MDVEARLPMKIIHFGFGFGILISVATYTANLAAFLTISAIEDYIGNIMDEAIVRQTRVGCGHPTLMRMIFQLFGLQSNGWSIVRIPACLTLVYA